MLTSGLVFRHMPQNNIFPPNWRSWKSHKIQVVKKGSKKRLHVFLEKQNLEDSWGVLTHIIKGNKVLQGWRHWCIKLWRERHSVQIITALWWLSGDTPAIQLSLLLVSNPLSIIPGSNPNKNSLFHKLDVGAMLTLFCSRSFSAVKDMCCFSPEKVFYVTVGTELGHKRPQKGQGGSDSRS